MFTYFTFICMIVLQTQATPAYAGGQDARTILHFWQSSTCIHMYMRITFVLYSCSTLREMTLVDDTKSDSSVRKFTFEGSLGIAYQASIYLCRRSQAMSIIIYNKIVIIRKVAVTFTYADTLLYRDFLMYVINQC